MAADKGTAAGGSTASDRPWLAHYPKEVPASLDYPDIPLPRLLQDAARDYPNRIATRFFGAARTYRQTWNEACNLARALRAHGIEPGDRVAIVLPNCPQAVSAFYGALLAGAVVVWVNPLYTVPELKHQLNDSGAKLAIILDLLWPRVQLVQSKTPIETVIVTSVKDRLPFPLSVLYPLKEKLPKVTYTNRVVSYRAALAAGAPGRGGDTQDDGNDPARADRTFPGLQRHGEDLALLQYTGGTTGVAKGVMLTHANLVANTTQIEAWLYKITREAGTTFLAVLPFFHVFGLTAILLYGTRLAATLVVMPRLDTKPLIEAIERYHVQIVAAMPTIYVAINRYAGIEKHDMSSVEACISGAAPLPKAVKDRFEALTGGSLVEGYGLTEASPVTHANPIWGGARSGTIGLPWPDTEARVADPETGRELPCGSVGELQIRGPQVMVGYWQRPDDTADTLRDGWLRTGDLAEMREDGYFRIVDRLKDLIIAGGYNIYPNEVEDALYLMPGVEEALVIGVPDDYRGETVKAFIKMRAGAATPSFDDVNRHCRAHLAAYKVPRLVEFRDELPKSAVGKLLRRKLADEEREKRETAAAAAAGAAGEAGRPA